MSSQKINVVESEKSSKVVSKNWLEGMLLSRSLLSLDQSEETVLGRISVDQRICARKFHKKIQRTKLAHARAVGDRAKHRDLLEKTTFLLNTNVAPEGREQLERIWSAGSIKYKQQRDKRKVVSGKERLLMVNTDHVKKEPESTSKQPLTRMRPATSHPLTTPNKDKDGSMAPSVVSSNNDHDDNTSVSTSGFSGKTQSTFRPQTAPFPLPDTNKGPAYSGKKVPKSPTRPKCRLFPSESDITLLDLHKYRIKCANYEKRVTVFCERIRPMTSQDGRVSDYYTSRLLEHAQSPRTPLVVLTGPSEQEYRRCAGNIHLKNMTIKSLDWTNKKRLPPV